MGTILRLGFAMGGGVSLGTFCGAALTEAIKLLTLFGKDKDGKPYEAVKVDVFSGASAGAMSLGIMLKALADPVPSGRTKAIANLDRLYGKTPQYQALKANDPRREDLIAAQMAQDVQQDVWVRRINIRSLLGFTGSGPRDLTCLPCLLDSGAVNDIAREVFTLQQPTRFPNRRVISDRVLFCCTLANLSPIVADARAELPGPSVGYVGLTDGMRSSVRRELRVFDLNFALRPEDGANGSLNVPAPAELLIANANLSARTGYPARWCRYQEEGGEVAGHVGDLTSPRTWARIGATTVASGAFPFAFAPVVLTRRRYEFGDRLWPRALTEAGLTDCYPFSYIDGGTFNNEPIREAFRLAAFIDAQDTDERFERRILFVDPFVSDENPSLRVPIHAITRLEPPAGLHPLAGFDPIHLTTLDRLLPHAVSIISALSDESRVVEADKIFQTRDRFRMRDAMRLFLTRALATGGVPAESYKGLRTFCETLLGRNTTDAMIPPGNLTLVAELERVIREAPAQDPIKSLRSKAAAFLAAADPAAHDAAANPAGGWLRALAWAALDLSLDLEGKNDDSALIAIAPFTGMTEYRDAVTTYQKALDAFHAAAAVGGNAEHPGEAPRPTPICLPGGEVSGFAGFMSATVRQHDFDAGIIAAAEFLGASNLLSTPFKPPITLTKYEWSQRPLLDELDSGVEGLAARVDACVSASNLLNLGWGLDKLALGALGRVAKGYVNRLKKLGRPSQSFEVRIYIPGTRFNLDGRGFSNIKPITDEAGRPYLRTFVTFHPPVLNGPPDGIWEGAHIHAASGVQVIPIDHDGLIDRLALSIALPDAPIRALADVYPNPILSCEVSQQDMGTSALRVPWTPTPGVAPLEDQFLPAKV